MPPPARPLSRRDRPAKAALTREGVVAAALAVLRAEGLGKVTMRRVAQDLDTGAASLYVYVRDTAELHAAMLDELLGGIDLEPTGEDAADRLWALVQAYAAILYSQPGLARVALVARLHGPHYLRLLDAALGLLREVGLPPGRAAWAVDVVLLVATSSAVEHGTRDVDPGAGADHEALVAAVDGATPDHLPDIAALGRDLVSGSGPQRARWAFDVLLHGAAATPLPHSPEPSPRSTP